ncbi:hydroxyacylglutathione hydrolase [Mycobacteroides abscessus subsp. bolletii]|nr:hydroxyacylglutathione hydrolase [Mycobacteroides abscessus subsp. bolletii]
MNTQVRKLIHPNNTVYPVSGGPMRRRTFLLGSAMLAASSLCSCASPRRPESAPAVGSWYSREVVSEHLNLYREIHADSFVAANIWHVRGPDRDMVVDTGLGVSSLRREIPTLFQRDPVAYVSHWHLDHSGGAHEFDDVRVFETGVPQLLRPPPASLRRHGLQKDLGLPEVGADALLLSQLPAPTYNPNQYRVIPVPNVKGISDSGVLDLGGKTQFRVVHLPGHTHDSSALFNERTGELFSGDVIYDDESEGLLDTTSDSSVAQYVASFQKLKQMDVQTTYPGHGRTLDRQTLRSMITQYLQKHA